LILQQKITYPQFMKHSVQIDAIDRKIIEELQRDGTLSNVVLAERVGASAASCWRRIKALEESRVLKKTVRLVDAQRIGRGINVICHVRMKNHQPENIAAFQSFVAERPEVMDCYMMSGDWDYLLRVVAGDVADYEQFLMRSLLRHSAVATASSHFALSQIKYETSVPL
jgi:DNA-binding Lrp family transcriptional regulator